MIKVRGWILCAGLALAPQTAHADAFFVANANGAQVVPANPSAGSGFGRVTLNEAETQITVSLYYSGLLTNVIEAHVHGPAASGATGPILQNLNAPPGTTSGQVVNLSAAVAPNVVADLKAGLFYVDVHTTGSPDGEIRGQFIVDPVLAATLSGAQQVPASGSAGAGRGFVSINAAGTQALATVRWSGLGTNTTIAHIHSGISGTNGDIVCDLNAPATATSGEIVDALCSLTPTYAAQLRTNGLYFNIHSQAFFSGEIRGQIKHTFNPCDFDGDSKSDLVITRSFGASRDWWIKLSGGGIQQFSWGTSDDGAFMCPDVDGDGKADATVWRLSFSAAPSTFWSRLSSGGIRAQNLGETYGGEPVMGDYDADGRDDYAVRNEFGAYFILESSTGILRVDVWGGLGDYPQVVPDYDGDGKTDLGVYRLSDGLFYRKVSSAGIDVVPWGQPGERHSSADYDGDGKTDITMRRLVDVAAFQWWTRSSLTRGPHHPYGSGFFFGLPFDQYTAADYDGDRRTDVAVWRPDTGAWWIQSQTGALTAIFWGALADFAVQSVYWQ